MTNIVRKRGDTYAIQLTLGEDVTGASFLLTVDPRKNPPDSSNNLFQITGTITDAANGVVDFPFTSTEADNVGHYFYDVQMTDTGVVYTVAQGRITFRQDITK